MEAARLEATIQPGGNLSLTGLPFAAGSTVEVIVLPRLKSVSDPLSQYPLRGTPVSFVDPTEPVSAEDWAATS